MLCYCCAYVTCICIKSKNYSKIQRFLELSEISNTSVANVKRSWKVGEPVARVAPFKARDGLAALRLIDNEKNQADLSRRFKRCTRSSVQLQ